MKWFAAVLGVMFLSLQAMATNLQLTLSWFNANPATNRTVFLYPTTPFAGNLIQGVADSNGILVFTNVPTGLINGAIQAPPGKIQFQVFITDANLGTIDASNCVATGSATTYPAGGTAWAISASDNRYALNSNSLSQAFYPLFSNPSNYVSTNSLGGAAYQLTNFFDLAGAGTTAAQQATNGFAGIATNIAYQQATNQGNFSTNFTLAQFLIATNYAGTNIANVIAIERAALNATNANLVLLQNASNTLVLSTATAQALAAWTLQATNGLFAFNLGASTNLPLSSITGLGPLLGWSAVTTNAYLANITNWTGNVLNWATNNLQAQITILAGQLVAGTNTGQAYVLLTSNSLQTIIVSTSNQLASAQSAGSNTVYGVSTNFANTNAIGLANAASNNFKAIFLPITNGTAQSLQVDTNFGINGNTNYLLGTTNLIGVALSSMSGVNGTYSLVAGSVWTNLNTSTFDVSLAAGVYSVRQSLVPLFTVSAPLPGILTATGAGIGSGAIYYGSYRLNNGIADIGYYNNSNNFAQWNGALNTVSNFFATNFVSGPLQASNLQGSFLALLAFTNGTVGQVFESDGNHGWFWSNTVPNSVTANLATSATGATTASNITANALNQVTNIASALVSGAVSGPTNVILINGNQGFTPLFFGPIGGGSGNNALRLTAGTTNLPILQADYENGNAFVILGGTNNKMGFAYLTPQIPSWYDTIIGGNSNVMSEGSILNASIFGGALNWIKGNASVHMQSTIVGGENNYITGVNLTNNTIIGGEFNGINGSALGGVIVQDSTIIGGISNYCGQPFTLASGWRAWATNYGSVVFSDPQTNLDIFNSTGTNQFLIRAIGGVGINTNQPAGYSMNISGAVNASAGFYVNGQLLQGAGGGATNLSPWNTNINGNGFTLTNVSIVDAGTIRQGTTNLQDIINNSVVAGSATNAIALLNGYGTNTTLVNMSLGNLKTNFVYFPNATFTITGSLFPLANGTYVPDANTNDYNYHNWVTNVWGSTFGISPTNITGIWTNNANTNFQIVQWPKNIPVTFGSSASPGGWGPPLITESALNGSALYYLASLTNDNTGGFYSFPTATFNPLGQWSLPFSSGAVGAVGPAVSTNYSVQTIYAQGQFTPITVTFPINGTSKEYSYSHGLGFTPHMVRWYFQCIIYDTNIPGVYGSLMQPGDVIEINAIRNGGNSINEYANTTNCAVDFKGGLLGSEGSYNITPRGGGNITSPGSFSNFLIRADIYP